MIRRNGDATVVEGEGVDGGQGSHTYESTTTGGDNGDGHNSANTRGEGGYEAPKPPSPTPYLVNYISTLSIDTIYGEMAERWGLRIMIAYQSLLLTKIKLIDYRASFNNNIIVSL